MIILILGGVGSGKTLSVVKEIINNNQYALTNFNLQNIDNYHRIKVKDIITKNKKACAVNWKFWEKIRNTHKNYSIYLDEVHNIIHSRRSMSKVNIVMSKWVSQIRKILSDSPNNHLYLISQTLRKIDIDFRDLSQLVCRCRKYEFGGKIYIKQEWFAGVEDYLMGIKRYAFRFQANPYYKYYDRLGLVTFEDAEEYV